MATENHRLNKEKHMKNIYNLKCEVILSVKANNIDEAEEIAKNKFNTEDTKFYQLIEYDIKGKIGG